MRALRIIITTLLLLVPAVSAGAGVIVETAPDPGVFSAVEAAARRWENALTARSSCLGTVTVAFEDLPSRRGEYRTREARVVIDVEVPAAEAPLVAGHELAHHAFVACGGYADPALAAAFYAAQGLPPDREWFDYSAGWSQTPAELFAEAMAVTLEGTTAHGTTITPAAVDVVARWMTGRPLSTPAPTTTTSTTTTTTLAPPPAASTTSPATATTPSVTGTPAPISAGPSAGAASIEPTPVDESVLGSSETGTANQPASVRLVRHLWRGDDEGRPSPPRID
jgi:hypothetical protein